MPYRRIYAKANRDNSISVVSAGPIGAAAILTWRSVVGRFLAIGIALCFLTPFGVGSQATAVWAIVGAAALTIVDAIWRLDRRQQATQKAVAPNPAYAPTERRPPSLTAIRKFLDRFGWTFGSPPSGQPS